MRILYFGPQSPYSTSFHRQEAVKRLGHEVKGCDLKDYLPSLDGRFLGRLHYRAGYRGVQRRAARVAESMLDDDFDLIWVNGGELFGPSVLKTLKRSGKPVILYNNDDIPGKRDGRRFDMVRQSVPLYDLCCVVREVNVVEYKAAGAANVLRVMMSYDEVAHQPFPETHSIPSQFQSEVAFIGTWMKGERRDEFLLDLLELGVPVSVWGARWDKSPHWNRITKSYRGPAVSGRDYVAAIRGAKICLGLLSKGNRDMHTQRSVEVPFAGGLLCAERTTEHAEMYQEGTEAVFWSDANECARICNRLLADDVGREKVRLAGMEKVRRLQVGNEDVCKQILSGLSMLDASVQSTQCQVIDSNGTSL